MISVEYPYYRTKVEHWEHDLRRIRNLGVKTVSFYVPWSFHADSTGGFDFVGKNHSQTNLNVFLEQIQINELEPVIKVGPYVHAELKYGGLPREALN